MSDLSRRSLLAGAPAAALVTTPVAAVAAVAVATEADPVFPVIEEHKRRLQASNFFPGEGPEFDALVDAEDQQLWVLAETEPTTVAGVVAMLAHMAENEGKWIGDDRTGSPFLTTVLTAVAALRAISGASEGGHNV